MRDQLDKVVVDAARATNRSAEVIQIAAQVHVGQDEQAIHVRSRRKTRTRLRVLPDRDLLAQRTGHHAFRACVSGTLPKHN